jgi:hypothetical protein
MLWSIARHSIICEKKTWRNKSSNDGLVNCHPFMFLSHKSQLNFLLSQGSYHTGSSSWNYLASSRHTAGKAEHFFFHSSVCDIVAFFKINLIKAFTTLSIKLVHCASLVPSCCSEEMAWLGPGLPLAGKAYVLCESSPSSPQSNYQQGTLASHYKP